MFAQLLDFLPQYEFDKGVARYDGNFRVRKLPTREQFFVPAFAQLYHGHGQIKLFFKQMKQ